MIEQQQQPAQAGRREQLQGSPRQEGWQAGWQARHNSDVAPDRKRTDTLTTMNVVYRFK